MFYAHRGASGARTYQLTEQGCGEAARVHDVCVQRQRPCGGTGTRPTEDQTTSERVFDRGDVWIETRDGELIKSRRNARSFFAGPRGLRHNLRWDALDAAYFAGYAWWNYLTTPILLTHDGVTITDGDTWPEAREQWRRLEVSLRSDIHTHSPRQTFYVDRAGLIRRHDYIAQPVGRWAHAAHYCSYHRFIAGLVFSARRRVCPRGPSGRSLRNPILVAPILVARDIDQIEVRRPVRPVDCIQGAIEADAVNVGATVISGVEGNVSSSR